jgi:regulator of sigma E protease
MHIVHAVISVLIVLGIMVVVHEFGHFVAAKLCGVRVEQFSVGFPPRLFGIKIGETDYCISAVPLGGYVKMTGESMPGENMSLNSDAAKEGKAHKHGDEEATPSPYPYPDPGALTSHPRWQRILIGVAGPCANFVLALVLMTGFYMLHNEVPLYADQPVTADWIAEGSAAAQAGFQPGDRIVNFDSLNNPSWEKVNERLALDLQSLGNHSVPVMVDRGGQRVSLNLQLPADGKVRDDVDYLTALGVLDVTQPGPLKVEDVSPGTPAYKAGIREGDLFLSVDGHVFHGTQSVISYMQSRKGAPLNLVVSHAGQTIPMVVQPVYDTTTPPSAWRVGFKGASPPFRVEQMPPLEAIAASIKANRAASGLILEVLKRVFTHRMSVGTLSGPLAIAQQTGQAWEATQTYGWEYMIKLMTTISLNLGILNLLPFPILDGGMILFLLIESLIRRDVNVVFKERVYQVAFVMILVFFAYIMFNDISKLAGFTQGRP